MSHWERGVRDFAKGWFSKLLEGLGTLDFETRKKLLKNFKDMAVSSSVFQEFSQIWEDPSNLESNKQKLNDVFDKINDNDGIIQNYFSEWFKVLVQGLENIDERTKQQILKPCGEWCSRSHVWPIFKEALSKSDGLLSFVENLNKMLGIGNIFNYENENQVKVFYPRCYCPLVKSEFVNSPLLCDCSNEWLRFNFSASLGKPVEVIREKTILGGANACKFTIKIS